MGLEEITCGENIDKIMTLTFRVWVEKKSTFLVSAVRPRRSSRQGKRKIGGIFCHRNNRKMNLKTTMKCHFTPTRMAMIKIRGNKC